MIQANKSNEIKPIKLGKKIELKYIPFSELAIPWNVCLDTSTSSQQNQDNRSHLYNLMERDSKNSKAKKILRSSELEHLKHSIAKYGLLKPFEVAEMYERLDFFYGKGKYLVIDGQRRYFAIRELLKLPTEDDEERRKALLRSDSDDEIVSKGEMQAQEAFDRLDVRDHILIPCILYPYTTLLQMVRHCVEDKRFSEKPEKQDYEIVEKMSSQGISDLKSDDLRALCKVRERIEEERASIEDTLNDIRTRLKHQQDQIKSEERAIT
jgi:hypothetical protein